MAKKLIHICEVCGKTEILTPEEAFNDGWDYLPRMGAFGMVGPRTCGNCPINLTTWWALVSEKKAMSELSQKQIETKKRIQGEPEKYYTEGGLDHDTNIIRTIPPLVRWRFCLHII